MDYQSSKIIKTKTKKEGFNGIEKNPIICVLDNLKEPHNITGIIELCRVFSIEKIYLCGVSAKIGINLKEKFHKLGIARWESVVFKNTTREAIEEIRQLDYEIYAVKNTEYSAPYYDIVSPEKIAFILGNENKGISSDILNLCHKAIHIPIYDKDSHINIPHKASIIISNTILKIKKC